MPQVVTRFAPSPTGHLHVGGARTALFCWALARKMGGSFILRIEDTDQARSSEEATAGILESMAWLGLEWDEGPGLEEGSGVGGRGSGETVGGDPRGVGPFFQAQRLEKYNEALERLIEDGNAYPAFETPAELDAARAAAVGRKENYRYDRAALKLPRDERMARLKAGDEHVVRFRMPDEAITVHDEVLGDVKLEADQLDDFVLRKRDGFPTYHLACVVDDELMGVTHVLRGQEHLINTPRHVALQRALGYRTPTYVHLPLIFNPDGSKMSKRDKDKAFKISWSQRMPVGHNGLTTESMQRLLVDSWHRTLIRSEKYNDQRRSRLCRLIDVLGSKSRMLARESEEMTECVSVACDALEYAHSTRTKTTIYAKQFRRWLLRTGILDLSLDKASTLETLSRWVEKKGAQLELNLLDALARALDVRLPEVNVSDFAASGYLPEVLCNYLALLGWNPGMKNEDGTDLERFNLSFLAEKFSIERLGKKPSKFDRDKLAAFNADKIQKDLSDEDFLYRWLRWALDYGMEQELRLGGDIVPHLRGDRGLALARAARPRTRTLRDAAEHVLFALIADDAIKFEGKAVAKVLRKGEPSGLVRLSEIRPVIEAIEPFGVKGIDSAIKSWCEQHEVGLGKVAQPLRVAMTGGTVSPGLGETLGLVGKAGVLARIDRCLAVHSDRITAGHGVSSVLSPRPSAALRVDNPS